MRPGAFLPMTTLQGFWVPFSLGHAGQGAGSGSCKKGAHRGCVREGQRMNRHSRPAPSPQPSGSPEIQRGLSLNLDEGTCPRLDSVEPHVGKVFHPMTLIM